MKDAVCLTDWQIEALRLATGKFGGIKSLSRSWGIPVRVLGGIAAGLARRGVDAKMRKCLGCQREFPSAWKGNRMCPRCLEKSSGVMA